MRLGIARRACLLLAVLSATAAAIPARAQAPVAAPEATACARHGNPRDRLDCLGNAQKDSERRLDRALAGAMAAIRADEAIQPVQRARWNNLMEEAQSRFVLWRNFECQSIAPFEGDGQRSVAGRLGGIGALEQRLVCLIARNGERAADLERRYPPPPGWSYAEPAPAPAAATPPAPANPTRIIEMPR